MFDHALRFARNLALGLLLLPLLAAPSAAAVDPDPDVTGIWTGKMSGKEYSQETDGLVRSVKYAVSARITRNGPDLEIEVTLTDPEGDESVTVLNGKIGNRAFWAYNGDSAEPVLAVGKVAGKLPKLSIAAKVTAVHAGGFQELKASLKRSKTAVLGTGATGAAVVGATLTLKDRNGASVVATTDADGRYSLDVARLTPPFLIKLDPLTGPDLYGVATAAGVANITPFTDLILKTWYGVQELDLATEFTSLDADTPVPSALDVALLEALVRRTIQNWLINDGIDPETFDLLRTPFDADGTGVDGLLDITTVAPDGSSITIDDGSTQQVSSVAADSVAGSVTIDSTVTSPTGTSEFTDGTVLAETDAMQAAVAAALATMEAFRAKINSRGADLAASDVTGYLTPTFLHDGDTRTWWTEELATDFRGATLGAMTLKAIRSFDEGDGELGLDIEVHFSGGGETGSDILPMDFKKVGSAWLMHGNRRIAIADIQVEYRTDYYNGSIDGPNKHINVDVRAPVGTVASVSITGGGVFDGTAVPSGEYIAITTTEPIPGGGEVDHQRDVFFAGANFVDYPAPGTPFVITVTPVSGTPQNYTVYSGATTTETVTISQPTGNSLATDAHPGTPFTAAWTLPSSFAITEFGFRGFAFTADFSCDVDPVNAVAIGDTTGQLNIPTTCGGQAVNRANMNLSFEGPNGERIMIIWDFQDP